MAVAGALCIWVNSIIRRRRIYDVSGAEHRYCDLITQFDGQCETQDKSLDRTIDYHGKES